MDNSYFAVLFPCLFIKSINRMNNEHISKYSSASSSVEGRDKAAVDYRYLRMARIWAENSYCNDVR